jgi:hypothetical protein
MHHKLCILYMYIIVCVCVCVCMCVCVKEKSRRIGHREKISYTFSTTAPPNDRRFSHLIPAEDSGGYGQSGTARTADSSRSYPPPNRFDPQSLSGATMEKSNSSDDYCTGAAGPSSTNGRSVYSNRDTTAFSAFSTRSFNNRTSHRESTSSEAAPTPSGFFDSNTRKGGDRSKRFFNK